MERYTPLVRSKLVKWTPSPRGWFKCNTDRASRGNPGPSAAIFCVRNEVGDILGAKRMRISDTSNLIAEGTAIREGLDFCV